MPLCQNIGINLASQFSQATSEQPFLNIFKTGATWFTRLNGSGTGEESLLYSSFLDANGYPTTLTGGPAHNFNQVQVFLLQSLVSPFYRSGTYVFLYDGTGTFTFSLDFSVQGETGPSGGSFGSGTGRIVISATASGNGTVFTMTSTGSPGYAHNFRLVYAPTATATVLDPNEAAVTAVNAGDLTQAFNPDFLSKIGPFKVLRFMDWLSTLSSHQTNFSDRPVVNWPFWNDGFKFNRVGQPLGNVGPVPIEVCCALCNKIGADAWFNMPGLSTSGIQPNVTYAYDSTCYVAQFALLVHSLLNSSSRVYVEYCNEVWNSTPLATGGVLGSGGPGGGGIIGAGYAAFPSIGSDFGAQLFYGSLRAVTDGKTWKTAWGGDRGRVLPVLGGQHAFPFQNQGQLDFTDTTYFTGTVANNIYALAVAPYVPLYNLTPLALTAAVDGGLASFFTEMNTGGILPTGSSSHTTSGTNTAFTVTSGQSLPATPPNGTIICVNFNQNAGSNPTLAADGGSAFPIQDGFGNAYSPPSGITNMVFTNATSQGSVTAGWRNNDLGFAGGAIAQINNFTSQDNVLTSARGIRLVCYEFGQTLTNSSDTALNTLNLAANRAAGMGTAYTNLIQGMFSNGVVSANHYHDIGIYTTHDFWGSLESVLQNTSPKYAALIDGLTCPIVPIGAVNGYMLLLALTSVPQLLTITDTTKVQLPINAVLIDDQDYVQGHTEIEANDPDVRTRPGPIGIGGELGSYKPSIRVRKLPN